MGEDRGDAILADDGPGAVGLLAGTAAGGLRLALDIDFLRVFRAVEAVRVVVIVANLELAIMAVARIAPAIGAIGTTGVEAVRIGLVGVAAIWQSRWFVSAAPIAPPMTTPATVAPVRLPSCPMALPKTPPIRPPAITAAGSTDWRQSR
jgi:hypothetical protein